MIFNDCKEDVRVMSPRGAGVITGAQRTLWKGEVLGEVVYVTLDSTSKEWSCSPGSLRRLEKES